MIEQPDTLSVGICLRQLIEYDAFSSTVLRYSLTYCYCVATCSAGVDLEARDAHGMTPLLLAAHSGNAAAMDSLLQLGADPSVYDSNRTNVLGHACQSVRLCCV